MPTGDIYVDASAASGGDGASTATAYRSIAAALADANSRPNGATIRVAPGTYVDASNTLAVTKPNVRILGSTVLARDARGLPTGGFANEARWKPATASGTLLTARASGFEVAGILFDGATPRPAFDAGVKLLVVTNGGDGSSPPVPLTGVSIHDNCFQDANQAIALRFADATIAGNLFARHGIALFCSGAYEQDPAHPDSVRLITFSRNRVLDSVNLGAAFGGSAGFLATSAFKGPGACRVVAEDNDFAGNGDARDPIGGVYYPQPMQYSAMLFLVMNATASDPLQTARVEAKVRRNTFRRNGYGVSVGVRVPLDAGVAKYEFDAELSGNAYCANGLNDLLVDFSLPSQSHLGAAPPGVFRYAVGAEYTIDAHGDDLTLDDVDYDHPESDPRLPGTPPLANTFLFDGSVVPPLPPHDPAVRPPEITHPPLASPGVFAPIATVDRKPPRIRSVVATPAALWPPNGEFVSVAIAVDAQDGCDPNPVSRIVSVTSDEPGGGQPDWEITGPLSLLLRASRLGRGDGRVYTVTVLCTDSAGNFATAAATVSVPHNLD